MLLILRKLFAPASCVARQAFDKCFVDFLFPPFCTHTHTHARTNTRAGTDTRIMQYARRIEDAMLLIL
jgi:hypothetical protein